MMTRLELLRETLELLDSLEEKLSELRLWRTFGDEVGSLQGRLTTCLRAAEQEAKVKSQAEKKAA